MGGLIYFWTVIIDEMFREFKNAIVKNMGVISTEEAI